MNFETRDRAMRKAPIRREDWGFLIAGRNEPVASILQDRDRSCMESRSGGISAKLSSPFTNRSEIGSRTPGARAG